MNCCRAFFGTVPNIIAVLGAFLTAMTFHSIHVEFYMTKISFLTDFFSVCVRALKTLCLLPRGAIFNRFCAVFMWARKKACCMHKRY